MRIHLMEIQKVNDLCKDFCTRYQARLKTTLQNEQLVQVNIDSLDEADSPPPISHHSITQLAATGQVITIQPQPVQLGSVGGGGIMMTGEFVQPTAAAASVMTLGQGQVVSGGTVYQMVQTPQGLVAQPIQVGTEVEW